MLAWRSSAKVNRRRDYISTDCGTGSQPCLARVAMDFAAIAQQGFDLRVPAISLTRFADRNHRVPLARGHWLTKDVS
jgi:hypothetical protein